MRGVAARCVPLSVAIAGIVGCGRRARPDAATSHVAAASGSAASSPDAAPRSITNAVLAALRDGRFAALATAPLADPLEMRYLADEPPSAAAFSLRGAGELVACLTDACAATGDALLGSWQTLDVDGDAAAVSCEDPDVAGATCCAIDAVSRADLGLLLDRVCVTGGVATRLDVIRDGY